MEGILVLLKKRLLSVLTSILLLSSSLPPLASAAEVSDPDPAAGMINISSNWKGSVFGDVGGQDKITAANFGITENADSTVTLRSSADRGKISGSTEGIAYYFQQIDPAADFELKAKAHVDAWTANNQVSFGLMLRGNVWDNQSGAYTGDFTAVGALDQEMKAFYKSGGGSLQKTGYLFDTAGKPAAGEDYDLSIRKTGNLYVFTLDGVTKTLEGFSGAVQYAGLYTARNTTVTFSNVQLLQEKPIELGPWTYSAFGGNTSAVKNPAPVDATETSVTLETYGGKISGSDEGLSFYFREIPAQANFELTATAKVLSFNSNSSISTPNQKSFGLMLRDSVGVNGDSAAVTSNYAAVGALDQVIKGFYKQSSQVKLAPFSGISVPAAGEEYALRIKKSGNTLQLSTGSQTETVTLDGAFSDTLFAGVYAARDAVVAFSDVDIRLETKAVTSLTADTSAMVKTSYFIGEALDLTGLSVKAVYSDSSEAVLSPADYIVTGFDSSKAGANTVTVHYNGASAAITLQILPLSVSGLIVKYYPAKTVYYPGDTFDPQGLVLLAGYNGSPPGTELDTTLYSLSINGQPVTEQAPYLFSGPGVYEVTAASVETPEVTTAFDITVEDAALSKLEIRNLPKQTLYYIGDTLKLEGLVLYAHYSDGTSQRLMKEEYSVSALDTSVPGSREITVSHKGATVKFPVEVKIKQLTGIEVTVYPKTSFLLDDSFSSNGLAVSKVYDNGDREVLSGYTLDTSKFDSKNAGVYDIVIIPADPDIDPISYPVTVREAAQPVWSSIHFGQSTSAANNQTVVREDGSIRLIALEGGGKVTEDHDGITFYYTVLDAVQDNFVLSADIQVSAYAKSPYDGQESFGIMARDVIGTAGNSSVFASNIAAIGGYSGGTKSSNGTQLFVRTGVESSDGAGSKGIKTVMLNTEQPAPGNTFPAAPYRLTLSKTNSGFTGQINDGKEAVFFTPDILNVQDGKMYVGFYTARLATIDVSSIQLTVTSAATDAPKIDPPQNAVTPAFDILSLGRTSQSDYRMILRPNVNGTVTLKQGSAVIAQDITAEAGKRLSLSAELAAQQDTNFSISFLPDDTQYLTSYDKIVRNFTVTMKSYAEGNDIYVSPAGTVTGDGTLEHPLDIDTAIDYVQPGQRIIVQDGRYVRSSKLEIKKYNDGTADAMKILEAAPGARPIFDFDKKTEGVLLSGSYWHVKGLDFTRTAGNTKGFTVGGNHNIVENSRFYANGDTGLQISRTDGTAVELAEWPSYNLILNSSSFDNRDPSDNNADGFAAKLTSGVGNVFRGCQSYNNIDDGWDLYTKAGTGAIGAVLIEDSAAFNNGHLTDGTVGAGDKNGFKLGGEGISVHHIIRNSVAFGNGAYGFTSNSNPGVIAENNIGFNNTRGNLSFTTYDHITPDFTIGGFLSYRTASIAKDQYPAGLAADNNYMYDGTVSANKSGKQLSDANFVSLTPVSVYSRDASGNVVWGDFLKFIPFDDNEPGEEEPAATPTPGATPAPSPTPAPALPGGTVTAADPAVSTVQPDGSVSITLAATAVQGKVQAVLSDASLQKALAVALNQADGTRLLRLQLKEEAATGAYAITIPASAFTAGTSRLQIEVNTAIASVVLPDQLFKADELAAAKAITLQISITEPSGVLKEQLGGAPLVAFELLLDGKPAGDSGSSSGVQVRLPYTAAVPAADQPFIVVWQISAGGVITAVVDSRYDTAAKQAVFTADRTAGQYAAVLHHPSFKDVSGSHWASHEIALLASRGILKGMPDSSFLPEQSVTRADFASLLVRLLGLSGAAGGNTAGFADVQPEDYFYGELITAKQHGLINGQPDGYFHPQEPVSRQDMFVMTVRALKAAGILQGDSAASSALSSFADRAEIASYAAGDIAVLAEAGFIKGDAGGQLNPSKLSTRAEAAVLIYRILMSL